MNRLRHGFFLFIERLLTWCLHPHWRAALLRLCGAKIGRNVRVLEARFFNIENGFSNLELADDCYIGLGCVFDLTEKIAIGLGSVISARTIVLTHMDAGSQHNAPLIEQYPVVRSGVRIGPNCFIGAGAIILAGTTLGERCLVAAGSVVRGEHPPGLLLAGSPATAKREIGSNKDAL